MKPYYRSGLCLIIVCLFLLFSIGCSGDKTSNLLNNAKSDAYKRPGWFMEDVNAVFLNRSNLYPLFAAGAASIVMHNNGADRDIADDFEEHGTFDNFEDESLGVIGNPWTQLAATGLWYCHSVNTENELNKQRSLIMARALTITGLTTFALKASRQNDTPNGKDWAWPSGHTAGSFTVASVLDEFYGHKVGIPAYALASAIGYRMMDVGDHWASDVVFGATLGWVVGHTVADKNKDLTIAGFEVVPFTASGCPTPSPATGINLVKQF